MFLKLILLLLRFSHKLNEIIFEAFSAHWALKLFEEPLGDALLVEHMSGSVHEGRPLLLNVTVEDLQAFSILEGTKADAA